VTHIDDGLLADETAARFAQALLSLAPDERDAIIRAYYGGSSYRDVALESGVAEGTIKSRIRRGLAQLRRSLPDLALVASRAASGTERQHESRTQT
jgi:RNA polymerase sigma factor (sigma-70 family)